MNTLPFAVFDEFGVPADDRVQDFILSAIAAHEAARPSEDDLRRALQGMLAHFDRPHRDEWLNDQAYQEACEACAQAHSVLGVEASRAAPALSAPPAAVSISKELADKMKATHRAITDAKVKKWMRLDAERAEDEKGIAISGYALLCEILDSMTVNQSSASSTGTEAADAARLHWLHSPASNNVDGYEWGIYRVKWENGRAAEVWQTYSDFSDLDAAMNEGESKWMS